MNRTISKLSTKHAARPRRTMAVGLLVLATLISLLAGNPGVTFAGSPAAATACPAMQVVPNTSVGGFISDQYRWMDSNCQLRTAAMVHNTVQDPAGKWGGYMRQYTYLVNGATRTANGSSNNFPGFGMTTNHFNPDQTDDFQSHNRKGTSYSTVFKGTNHAIHEYRTRLTLDGHPVDATIQWMFATGRDHPIYAITYDSRPTGPNIIRNADTRSPYGDIQYDGGAHAEIAGVGWGDHYKFKTTSVPVTYQSSWDYTQPNTVPYAMSWTSSVDAEMGLVQTQTYKQHDAGGFWGYTLWGKTSASAGIDPETIEPGAGNKMPAAFNWPYQINQWEIYGEAPHLTSKRLAWGTNGGAVGRTSYPALGDATTLSGYPFQSYSVSIVLGKHTAGSVAAQVREVETVQRTTLTARTGVVAAKGPGGVGRTDLVALHPLGYNQIFGTWELGAGAQNAVDFDMNIASGTLKDPIFVIRNYTATAVPNTITVNGVVQQKGVGFFPSVDTVNKKLWVTLRGTFANKTTIRIGAAPVVAEPTLPVYADAMAAGWGDWSWGGVTRSFVNKTPVHAGTASIATTYTAGWSGIKMGRDTAINVTAYNVVRFWIHGGTVGNQNIIVDVTNASGHIEKAIRPQAGVWTKVEIPLAGLATKQVTEIDWFNNTDGAQPTFYIDDVSFVKVATP